jgi:hypothetical protein
MFCLYIFIAIISLGIVLFMKINKGSMENMKRENLIIERAHREINYPTLDELTQCYILETGDMSAIINLIPELSKMGIPLSLLPKYITISRERFREYLKDINFLDKQTRNLSSEPRQDGIWYYQNKVVEIERGQAQNIWDVSNEEEALELYITLLWHKLTY